MGDNRNEAVTIHDAVEGGILGDPSRYQIDPDERDPVTGETADEAEAVLDRRGLVNPFHAVELQRRRMVEKRRQNEDEPSLGEILLADENDGEDVETCPECGSEAVGPWSRCPQCGTNLPEADR